MLEFVVFFFLLSRRPPRSTQSRSSAASDVYKRQVIITLVVFAYSALSGLWGAYATSVVQVVIIIAGLVGTTIALLANGGVAAITSAVASGAVPAEYLDPFAGGVKPIFMMLIPITLALIADQGTVQRINSSRSASVAFKGFMLSFLIMIPVAFMPAFIGMYLSLIHI